MRLFDDTTNRQGSDAGTYVPGQNAQGAYGNDPYQNNQLSDADGYQSTNKQGQQDPEFQDQFQKKERGGLAKQAGNAFGKIKSAAGNLEDSPENRERIKQEAKERIRKYTKDKVKDKFGEEVKDLSKDAIKKAGKDVVKNVGKQVGKQALKEGGKLAVEGGVDVLAEGGIATAGALSAFETLGIGLLIAILLEIAMYLGLNDAIDCAFELSHGNVKKALFHAHKAGMLVLMGFLLIIDIIITCTVVGWIVGLPLLVLLNIYMLLGFAFPNTGLLQGLSKKLIQAIVLVFDLITIIVLLAFAAGVLYYICQTSGLGSGFFANLGSKVVDWWSGSDFASTFNDVCTQISNF